ncbi:hypothetical protein TNCV_3347681 [Trichonephila clavipes]|nr:hypothetical protein TNCV_3347681 [Trichonephila clavipes]
MPFEQREMFPKKEKVLRRLLEYPKMWNEFVCQFRPVCDDPVIRTRSPRNRSWRVFNKMGPQSTPPGF